MAAVTEIQSLDHFRQICASPNKIVIYSKASWCRPCDSIGPVFDTVAEQHRANIDFYAFDVDAVEELPEELGIRSMPTFIYLKAGEKCGQIVGANPEKLEQFITLTLQDE